MKKLFIKFSMMLFLLAMSVNAAWAEEEVKIYFASLKAQKSPASTGDGLVKLTWLDICGRPMTVDLAKQINWAVNQETYDWKNQMSAFQGLNFMSKVNNWDSIAGARAYDGEAETAQLLGGTLIAIDGMEQYAEIGNGSQIYMTSFVYFHAETMPENGSYLSEWTFTDPAISRIDTAMGGDVKGGLLGNSTGETTPKLSPCFKVLPDKINSSLYDKNNPIAMAAAFAKAKEVADTPNNIYAVFNKYLLGNPVATSANIEAVENEQAHLTVTVEVNGDTASLDEADFGTFVFSNNGNGEWSYDLAAAWASKKQVSAQKTRIVIPVTYTYKGTGAGTKNTTMTIRMAGDDPSILNVNLSVNALDPNRPAAFWYDGEKEKASGDLSNMLDVNISAYTNPILKLNKPVNTALTFVGKDFTLDLNGNVAQAITISSGNVTVAYSKFGGSATSLTVNGGKAILNGGTFGMLTIGANGTVEQNGATITGAATNAGSLTTTEGAFNDGLTSSKTLVLNGGTFKGETAITVSGGTAGINRGTIEGTTNGLKVTGGTATVKKLAAIKGGTNSVLADGGTVNIECGKFEGALSAVTTFTSGYFKNANDTVGLSAGKEWMQLTNGVEYNEGYRYFLGTAETAVSNGVGVCRIGNVSYAKLEDAIAFANNNPNVENIVIFMTNNYTLPAGYYTLPANATIVVPMSDTQAKEVNMTAPRVVFNDQRTETPYVDIQPSEFRRLTFAKGVNMDVFGDIELTCSQYASNEAYTSQPVGPYGHLVMEEGCHLTLQSGSEVRAWGFVTGKGEMDARRGATVREMFQLGDWKGAMTSVAITGLVTSDNEVLCGIVKSQGNVDNCDYSDKKIFPVTQYFIQNIESPVKYHPGSLLSTSAAVSEGLMGMSVSMAATDIGIIGVSRSNTDRDVAIFLMDEKADADNTWVRKWYDSENDIQVYDVNSAAHIGSMVLDMGDINLLQFGTVPIRLNSAKFDLPLTCNFKIHLLSGTMDFLQNTSLLPGAEVEVDKEATVTVAMDQTEKSAYEAWIDGGKAGDAPVSYTGALYVYDAEEWDKYAYCNEWNGSQMVSGKAYTKTVRYAPSWKGRPTKRNEQTKPADAAINVHGTFMTATGFVYTSESGANIFSNNEDAGTFIFNDDAVNAGTRTVNNVKGVKTYESRTFYPARLKHGNGEYEDTDEAVADLAYCYQNDRWSTMIQDGCFMKENRGGIDIYYAKPQEYVALANGMTPNADNTYSDADGAGRLFILMDNCQWWEVEKKDNLYHCIHPNNDTYYYLRVDTLNKGTINEFIKQYWDEKRYTITWKNYDGTIIQTADADGKPQNSYSVTYGTMAEFFGTNPMREKTIDYTYDFTGWTPALGPVTSDVTYTATYTQKPRMYTIIFQNEGGVEIERQFLTHNEVPVCENVPMKVGHTLVWNPAIAAVTRDTTYVATWLEVPPTKYEVTFFDYDGKTPLQRDSVAVGAMPEYTRPTPTGKATWAEKQNNKEFTYVFDHWSPALEEVSATSIKSYTAVYAEVAKTYTIKFVKENGDPDVPKDVIESHQYQYGETPICANTPTKDATAQYTYTLRWTPQIQTVMEDANYTAVFDAITNKYTVSLKANPSGACTFTGAGTFDYGTAIAIARVDNEGYTFSNWTDKEGNVVSVLPTTLTGDVDLVANFTVADPDWTITWKNEAGTANLVDPVGQKAGTATIYTGAIPTKPATAQYTYTFDGWTTKANGAGTFYKNNMTPKATANATYYAHFAATEVIMEVGLGQAQNIAEETTVNQLILNSNGTVSGQLTGDLNHLLNVTGVCYYDLTGTFKAGNWYAVAVPWQVTASDIRANGNALSLMSGDYLAYYDGSVRAAQGKVDACWKYLSKSDVLVPGHLYMLYLQNDASVLRFPKKSGTPILTSETSISMYGSDEPTNANWNGIANPAIFYAYLNNTGASVGQVFNAASQSYEPVALSNKLIVAKPIFVQATNSGLVPAVTTPLAPAPVRRNVVDETLKAEFQVEIASYGRMQDRLFIHTNDNKEADTYTLGQDVLKFGISNSVAQMWVNRYDAKLCMNTVVPFNNVAEFPLSIFAPRAGEYTISKVKSKMSKECDLYLTRNGEAIWNLSESDYVMTLEQGTTAEYGLRVSAKAPQVATGMDEAVVDAQGETKKVLIDNKVFIIRGNNVYSIDGQLVK